MYGNLNSRTFAAVAFLFLVAVTAAVAGCGAEKNDARPTSLDQGKPVAQRTRSPTVPPGPSPTNGPPQATATQAARARGADRDRVRTEDLIGIQHALEQYHQKHNTYPSTQGGIQTLCVYMKLDQGCKLEAVLTPIPFDPLGDPGTNGYWYRSDGATYTVFGQRESNVVSECDEHPEHLKDFKSVMCVRSP